MMEHYSPSSIVFQCSSSPPSSAEPTTHMGSLMNAAAIDDDDHFQFNNNMGGMFPLMSNTTTTDVTADQYNPIITTNSDGSNVSQNSEGIQSNSCKKKGELNEKKSVNNKKPKFAFQTRSQVDILDDGYRWRKYGQKAVKNNRFPRSYYRCTHQGCNVKKQVQRLSKDEGIVVTTYEGMHSHSIDKSTDNFDHILSQMHVYTSF